MRIAAGRAFWEEGQGRRPGGEKGVCIGGRWGWSTAGELGMRSAGSEG